VYIVSAAANYGLMLPSSSAGPAIAAGYGVDLRAMAWRGLWLTGVIWLLLLGIGYNLIRISPMPHLPLKTCDGNPPILPVEDLPCRP
jgi:hypothetical protein